MGRVTAWATNRLSKTSVPPTWHAAAQAHVVYRLSPLFYLALLVQLTVPPAYSLEPLECIVQLLIVCTSYMSDVRTLGHDSGWHAADRLISYGYTAWVTAKVVVLTAATGGTAYARAQLLAGALTLVVGGAMIAASWAAVRDRNCAAFLWRHALWHACFPIGMCVFHALRHVHE